MLQSLCLSFIYNPLNQHKKENIKGNTERLQLLQQVDSLLSSLNHWLCVCVTVLEFCVLESLKILCFGFSCDFYCLELLVYCFQVFELLFTSVMWFLLVFELFLFLTFVLKLV